jgi:hypothetical protein
LTPYFVSIKHPGKEEKPLLPRYDTLKQASDKAEELKQQHPTATIGVNSVPQAKGGK